MKLLLHDAKTLLMSEVYNAVSFDNDEGELLSITMRDDGFELISQNKKTKKTRSFFINSERIESPPGTVIK